MDFDNTLPDRRIHVYPIDDGKEHLSNNLNCWCEPTYELIEGYDDLLGAVILHKQLQ